MARRPYTTRARLFKDSDQEVDLKWYPVAEPVEVLPFPSKVNSLDWCSHPWLAAGVGEVWGESRGYNGAKALPYAVGLTPCKPAEVFTEGETLDLDAPPQLYNLDGFPTCCLDLWTPEGGIEWDGDTPDPATLFMSGTCAGAVAHGSLPLTVGAAYSVQAGFPELWTQVNITPAGPWRVLITSFLRPDAVVRFYSGTCAGLTQEFVATAAGQLSPVFNGATDVRLIKAELFAGLPFSVAFEVLPG